MPLRAFAPGLTNIEEERPVMNYNSAGTDGPKWTYSRPRAISLRLGLEF